MAQTNKIRATYNEGIITPLDKLNLPDGQELELKFKVLPSATTELSKEEKKNLIQKIRNSMKGTWGVVLKRSMLTSSQKGRHGIESKVYLINLM